MSFKDARQGRGLITVETRRIERISPNFVRVTVAGDLTPLPEHGYDQWFRLFLPREEGATTFELPDRVDLVGYLQYLALGAKRPHMRNYTVRERRSEELDIDFVVHGDDGPATRWCTRTRAGDRVALIDQGRGFEPRVGPLLLVADETGLPAVAGILRDLPRDARGDAFVELAHADDAQPIAGPDGVRVHWVVRPPNALCGDAVLDAVQGTITPAPDLAAYLVGEQRIPATLRRWLLAGGAQKSAIDFVGYWKRAKDHLGGKVAA